jgi:hypothetical protein
MPSQTAEGEPKQGEPTPSRKNPVPKDGHLPVSEFLGELQGPPSPFGDDIEFPLPIAKLGYVHPDPKAIRVAE